MTHCFLIIAYYTTKHGGSFNSSRKTHAIQMYVCIIYIFTYTLYITYATMIMWHCSHRYSNILCSYHFVLLSKQNKINITSISFQYRYNVLLDIFKWGQLIKRIYHKNKRIINLLMHTYIHINTYIRTYNRTSLLYRSVNHKALGL